MSEKEVLLQYPELSVLTLSSATLPSQVQKWGIQSFIVFGVCDVTPLFKPKLVFSSVKVSVKSTLTARQVCGEPFIFHQTDSKR